MVNAEGRLTQKKNTEGVWCHIIFKNWDRKKLLMCAVDKITRKENIKEIYIIYLYTMLLNIAKPYIFYIS